MKVALGNAYDGHVSELKKNLIMKTCKLKDHSALRSNELLIHKTKTNEQTKPTGESQNNDGE